MIPVAMDTSRARGWFLQFKVTFQANVTPGYIIGTSALTLSKYARITFRKVLFNSATASLCSGRFVPKVTLLVALQWLAAAEDT